MCKKSIKVLSKVRSGELSFCMQCQVYHLQFNNIYLELSEQEFQQFREYILNIEIDYWEHKYACATMKRKIPINSLQPNLVLMFKRQEVNELQTLFSGDIEDVFDNNLDISEIDYTLILN